MAANIRMIGTNLADTATITSSSAASSSLGVGNLTSDIKSQVLRTTGVTAETVKVAWTNAVTLQAVVFPWSNLKAGDTISVTGYSDTAGTIQTSASGDISACPAALPLAIGDYNNYTCARVWLAAPITVKCILITVKSPAHPAGYIELGRIVCAAYWEGVKNVDYGATLTPVDSSKTYRNDAGDLLVDVGPTHNKLTFTHSTLSPSERAIFFAMIRAKGRRTPFFISVFPNSADAELERDHQGWFRLTNDPGVGMPSFLQYTVSPEFEEI